MKKLIVLLWNWILSLFTNKEIPVITPEINALPIRKKTKPYISKVKYAFYNNRHASKGRVLQVIYLQNGITKTIRHLNKRT